MSHTSGPHFPPLAPRSKFYQGPYGRLCPDLDPWEPAGSIEEQDAFFLNFANVNMVEAPGLTPGDIAQDNARIAQLEQAFGSNIPAGYTYFGQFIDHDITFDPTSLMMRRIDPNGLLNFRTPRLDLDCVYGSGPADQPYLYDQNDKSKLLVGEIPGTSLPDLPRNSQGRALIGDMRNDENAMVCQVQLAFLLAHNRLVDRARSAGAKDAFSAAQRTLRWLYQHVAWNDYLKRVTLNTVHRHALKLRTEKDERSLWKLGLSEIYSWRHNPYMPVEFSGAAYRFGHSLVRNGYQTNQPHRGFGNFAAIFDNSGAPNPDDLRGFRPLQAGNVLQWDWFLPMTTSSGPFPQMGRKIDTKLSNSLTHLFEGPSGERENVLAFRNLKRGVMLGLPSGVEVAKKFCIDPVDVDPEEPESLWYCILKEAEMLPGADAGQTLGQLGSTIVCSVFAGLLKGDPCSYLNVDPCWTPNDDPLLQSGIDNIDDESWSLASIIRLSGLPVDAGDVGS